MDTVVDAQYPPVHYSINYTINGTGYSSNSTSNSITIMGDGLQYNDIITVTVAPTNIVGVGQYITTTGINSEAYINLSGPVYHNYSNSISTNLIHPVI